MRKLQNVPKKLCQGWNRGFTLTELLIVIAIIGILAMIILAAINSARLKARNAHRVAQFTQIKRALEMYYDDHGAYPSSGGWLINQCSGATARDPDTIIPGLVPTYMPKIVSDPTLKYVPSVSWQSCLAYVSDGRDYSLLLTNLLDPSPGHGNFDYAAYPAFLSMYADGGTDPCSFDSTHYNALVADTNGICTSTTIHGLW